MTRAFRISWLLLFLTACLNGIATDTFAQGGTDTTAPAISKPPKWVIGGYLKDLQFVQFTDVNAQWSLENLVHNRIDVQWYPAAGWKVHLGLRNRFFYGDSVVIAEQHQALLSGPTDLFKLGKVIATGPSYLLHSAVDRAYVDYTHYKWEVTAGRQRINWGLNLVWNPNDVFNAYSYFDFDYEERPGSGALRVHYFRNSTSSVELAVEPGREWDSTTIAALYKFDYKSYDLQFLAGKVNGDLAFGGGWSGNLGKAGFNGEATVFIPSTSIALPGTVVSASAGVNYTFLHSLYLHGAYLFNSAGALKTGPVDYNLLLTEVTAKNLSPARHSLFGEVAFPFTPLIRGDLASIVDPGDGSFFVGPSCTFSLGNNVEFLAGGQLFFGAAGTLYGSYGHIFYLRLKWSF